MGSSLLRAAARTGLGGLQGADTGAPPPLLTQVCCRTGV
jgi:hypothetical protein